MINYTKRVVIFKEVFSNYTLDNKAFRGSCLIENKESATTFNFDFLCQIKERLTIYICGDNENIKVLSLPNKQRFSVNFNEFFIKNGVIIAIFDNERLVFIGKSGNSFYDIEEIKNYAKNQCARKKEINLSSDETCQNKKFEYNDEVIATENYYKIENEREYLHSENANEFNADSQKQQIEKNTIKPREHEENIRPIKAWDFYGKIKSSLDSIFTSYPICNDFNEIFPDSMFVKIHYADNEYYYVGKLFENGILKYLCYCVEGKFNSNFNENIENFTFIPKSKFNLMGEGFFVIFQSAENGEIIKQN